MDIFFEVDMNSFLTATDEEIEGRVNSPSVVGKGNINLYYPMTASVIQQFWQDYHCDRCGRCCTGELFPSEVGLILTNVEIKRLAGIKQISIEEFTDRFTVMKKGRLLMKYPCPFIPGCSIYQDRPMVCRLYPINLPFKINNSHPKIDGTYVLTVDSYCPEARKVAIKWIKTMRDAYTSLMAMSTDEYTDIENKVLAGLEGAREWQKGIQVI